MIGKARIMSDYIKVISFERTGEESIVTVSCPDYQAHGQLPDAVEFENRIHVMTGWNSDRGVAYYKSSGFWARKVWSAR